MGLDFAEGMFLCRKRSNYTCLVRVTLKRPVVFISALHMGSSSWRGLNLTEELLLMSFPWSFCLADLGPRWESDLGRGLQVLLAN